MAPEEGHSSCGTVLCLYSWSDEKLFWQFMSCVNWESNVVRLRDRSCLRLQTLKDSSPMPVVCDPPQEQSRNSVFEAKQIDNAWLVTSQTQLSACNHANGSCQIVSLSSVFVRPSVNKEVKC